MKGKIKFAKLTSDRGILAQIIFDEPVQLVKGDTLSVIFKVKKGEIFPSKVVVNRIVNFKAKQVKP